MEHPLNVPASFKALRRIAQVTFDQVKPIVEVGQVPMASRRKIIQDAHDVAAFDKSRRQMRPDETRAAGYQNVSHVDTAYAQLRIANSQSRRTNPDPLYTIYCSESLIAIGSYSLSPKSKHFKERGVTGPERD
jgi:hypothetical protein